MALCASALVGQADVPGTASQVDDSGPGRGVARVSIVNGEVSVRRGDSGEVVAGALNSAVMVGDAIITGQQSRAEVQFDGSNMMRIGAMSDVRLSELEFHRYMLQVAAGTITFRVLRNNDASIEVSTPSVALRPAHRGIYRVSIRPDGTSLITVRQGDLDIYTSKGSEHLNAGQAMLVRGEAEPEYQILSAGAEDEWDRWNAGRDQMMEHALSTQFVNPDIYGAEDLDGNGRWVNNPTYGQVWAPTVTSDWAPYRNGRWVWQDYYGWSWVSYDIWGWAPYHYGRWFQDAGAGWCWWPGARTGHHYWRPALVEFFGFGGAGNGLGFGFGHVGWVPLAPHEPFHPWWGRGIYGGYRGGAGAPHGFISSNVNITTVYRNARIDNAVTGVSSGQFGRAAVGAGTVRVTRGDLQSVGLVRGQLPLAPDRGSLHASDRMPKTPAPSSNNRFFQTRQPTAVSRVPFEQQRSQTQQAFRSTPPLTGGAWRPMAPSIADRPTPSRPAAAASGSGGPGGWRRVDQGSIPPSRASSLPSQGVYAGGYERQPMRMNPSIVQPRSSVSQPGGPVYSPQSRPTSTYSQPGYRTSGPPPTSGGGSRPAPSTPSAGGRSSGRRN